MVQVVLIQNQEVLLFFQQLHIQEEVVEVAVILTHLLLLKQVVQVEEDHKALVHQVLQVIHLL